MWNVSREGAISRRRRGHDTSQDEGKSATNSRLRLGSNEDVKVGGVIHLSGPVNRIMRLAMSGVCRKTKLSFSFSSRAKYWRSPSSLTPRHRAKLHCLRHGNEVDSKNTLVPSETRLSRLGRALRHIPANAHLSTTSSLISDLGASTTMFPL